MKQWYESQTLWSGRGNAATIDKAERAKEGKEETEYEAFNGGIMGHGIGFSRILADLPGLYELAPLTQLVRLPLFCVRRGLMR